MVSVPERIPPQDLDAEMSALGAMMFSPQALEAVLQQCRSEDFYRPSHRAIFDSIASLVDRGEAVDPITVKDELQRVGKLQECGGMDYLLQLTESVPSAANAGYYANIVVENAIRRNLRSAGAEVMQLAYGEDEVAEVIDQAEQRIFAVGQRRMGKDFQPAKQLITEYFERVEEAYATHKRQMGMPTGFADLDDLTTGLYPSDFIIIAARPSVGKTALALHIAMNCAMRHQATTAFFSLEMSASQLAQRMVCSVAGINSQRARTVNLSEDDFDRIHAAADKLYTVPLYIDDSSDISTLELMAKCRRLKAQHGLGLVVVDYLQLMRGAKRSENRTQEISEIARGLKRIAKDLEVPVIALSQLSRLVEHRENKRPVLSDLRESGSIEAEADVVMLLYRASYYKQEAEGETAEEDARAPGEPDTVEVNIAKHRNGPTGVVKLAFQREFARFLSFARGSE
ncbi:MAG: replicative DNA helicase [Fimbriimonadales bacterium]